MVFTLRRGWLGQRTDQTCLMTEWESDGNREININTGMDR